MFGWLDTSEAVALAQDISTEISASIPVEQPGKAKKKREEKVSRKLASIIQKGVVSLDSKKFNFYQKAKFLKHLQQELGNRGYAQDVAGEIVSAMLIRR